jgi:hypothetical protein
MERSSGPAFRLRGVIAIVAALLVSVSALALPQSSMNAARCPMSGVPTCCCTQGDAPGDASAGCCRQTEPDDAAPSLQPAASPALAAPAAIPCDLPDLSLAAPSPGRSHPVAPRARSAPLFLLFASLLV